jgi:hypothetical protein
MYRRLAATLAALALPLLFVAPVLAGGWAEVRPDAAATIEPPREGQTVEIGFTVLQHGETPAGWVTPTVHLVDITSGATLDVPASGRGPDGHFVATFTPSTAGFWSWTVSFPELAFDRIPVTLAVHAADGTAPVFDVAMAATAIDRVRTSVRDEVMAALAPDVERLDGLVGLQRQSIEGLQADLAALAVERDALAAAAGDGATSPAALGGIILLAILAGGAAGFLMAWLGGRNGPRQTEVSLSRAPRGSTPA